MPVHQGRACLLHLPGLLVGLDEDTAVATNLHAFLVPGVTPHPHPWPTQISSLDGTMTCLVFQSHPRSPKYIQIRMKEFLSPSPQM